MTVPLFFALYCLEAGLFFIVVPWTRVWSMNPILQASPQLLILAGNPFVREGRWTFFGRQPLG